MFRLAAKSVRHNPKRLILTAFAVALGVGLIAATHIFTDSLDRGFTRLFGEIYDGVDVIVEPITDGGEVGDPTSGDSVAKNLDDDAVRIAQDAAGVDLAMGATEALGALIGTDGETLSGGSGFGPPTLFFNWTGVEDFDSATLLDGRAPEADDELVVDVDTAEQHGLAVGDQVVVGGAEGTYPSTVVGIATWGDSNNTQGATLVWTSLDRVRELGGGDGWTVIHVRVDDGADAEAVAAAIDTALPEGARALTGAAKAEEQAESLGEALKAVDIFTLAFAFVALFVGAYIIANTFRIIVTQRTREFGLMRAVGVKGQQVRTMVLGEALLIGIVASVTGILMGYALAGGIIWLLKALGPGESFAAPIIPLDAIIWGFAVGILVTLASALLPAIHASRISPMEAMREAAVQNRRGLTMRNIVGGALALTGAGLTTVGLYAGLDRPYVYVGAGAVLLVLGVTLLAAQLLVPLAFGMRDLLTRIWRVDGKLAANNIHREPRRSANTAAALMIGVMLLALTATVTQTVKAVANDAIGGQFTADLMVVSTTVPGSPDQSVVDELASVAGVETVTRSASLDARVDGVKIPVTVLDTATAEEAIAYETEPSFSEIDGGVFVSPSAIEAGAEVGDTVTLVGEEGEISLEVTGTYPNSGDGDYFVDFAQAEQLGSPIDVWQYSIVAESGADLDQVRADLEDLVATEYPLLTVQSPDDMLELANQLIDLMLAVITALLSGALVIAVLGVANTLLLSVTERTREIGLLRAVGSRRRSVRRMIRIESVVMSLFGAILGIVLGVALGVALIRALEEFGFDTVAIPWGMLAIYTVLAIVAGIVAAWWPARRAAKMDVLEAIAFDG
ncbi:ABC transporter permease [Demequina mangrovi]|uniref:Putative ABC transport system permease protein n=1 Tax=Demequina mangrovi TaxID=1043493 RepID=A0A1H6WRC8_9MICO|nr:ABC transporter permease [Demequina mangrovi]SEJ15032.1 putative ABC transport system permease protein [Demequina mangrovi]